MFNNPNEWENEKAEYQDSDGYTSGNEEDFEENVSLTDSDYQEEYNPDGETEDGYSDGYSSDEVEYTSDDEYSSQGDDEEEYDSGEYTDEEYEEAEDEDFEESEESEEDDGSGLKKKVLIGGVSVALLTVLIIGGFIGMKMMKKNSEKATANIENVDGELSGGNAVEKQETIIDENGDELTVIDIANDESSSNPEAGSPILPEDERITGKTGEDALQDKSGLEIEEGGKTAKSANDDGLVDIKIGEVGRKNPFMPVGDASVSLTPIETVEKTSSEGFEIIEPPALMPSDSTVSKLLGTKVSGIMYDEESPSAIINIDGFDQLVKIGDELENFFIIDITKNKVVIKSDTNIYKASVGQPLNSEKVVNSAEISNLEHKFYGSRN